MFARQLARGREVVGLGVRIDDKSDAQRLARIAARGRRVLLIDLDSQSHCAIGLGVPQVRGAASAQGFLAGHNTLRQALRPCVPVLLLSVASNVLLVLGGSQ